MKSKFISSRQLSCGKHPSCASAMKMVILPPFLKIVRGRFCYWSRGLTQISKMCLWWRPMRHEEIMWKHPRKFKDAPRSNWFWSRGENMEDNLWWNMILLLACLGHFSIPRPQWHLIGGLKEAYQHKWCDGSWWRYHQHSVKCFVAWWM